MNIFIEAPFLLLGISTVFGLLMAFGIGANDVANAMGTSVGSRALTIRQAVLVAAIFEFAGALLAGGEVTQTIRGTLLNLDHFAGQANVLALGMLASLMSAGGWLLLASIKGWPVSTTHSVLGAIVGFAWVAHGAEAVEWGIIRKIVGSWLITPVLAGLLAYCIFFSIQKTIFNSEKPYESAKRYGPLYIFLASVILLQVTLLKSLSWLSLSQSIAIAVAGAALLSSAGYLYLARLPQDSAVKEEGSLPGVERIFKVLMVNTACAMAFAHGSNDVANAMGPLATIVSLVQTGGDINQTLPMASWILPLGGMGLVLGLGILGYKVIATIGTGITDLSPSRGFVAELATATTVVIASGTGLPISTTQTLVGAILGVGFARGIAALNLKVVQSIFTSWLITLPAGALLSMICYKVLAYFFLR